MTSNRKEQKRKGNTTHFGLMMMTYKWMEDKAAYSDKIIIRHNDYIFMWQTKGFSWSEIIYVGNLDWYERKQIIFNLIEYL